MSDPVNHPSHYGGDIENNPYETIKVLRAWYGLDAVLAFCHLNAAKYLSRAGKKGPMLEDLKKARWYLDYQIRELEAAAIIASPSVGKL